MKKERIMALTAAAVMALTLAACGDENNGGKAEPASPVSAGDAGNTTTTTAADNADETTTTTTTTTVTEETESPADTTTAPEESSGNYTTTEVSTDADGGLIYNRIDDVDLGNEVIYDEGSIKVTLEKFTVEDDDILNVPVGSVVVDIENNTSNNIIVSLDDFRVNGEKVYFLWSENVTVYAGISTSGHFSVTGGQMIGDTGFNFNDIEKITFNIEIKEDVTNNLIADPIPYEIDI